jgi:hypothetical protein
MRFPSPNRRWSAGDNAPAGGRQARGGLPADPGGRVLTKGFLRSGTGPPADGPQAWKAGIHNAAMGGSPCGSQAPNAEGGKEGALVLGAHPPGSVDHIPAGRFCHTAQHAPSGALSPLRNRSGKPSLWDEKSTLEHGGGVFDSPSGGRGGLI